MMLYMYRGTSEGVVKHCIELKSQPVGMERINKNIYVGTMDQMLHCFTAKVMLSLHLSVCLCVCLSVLSACLYLFPSLPPSL